MKIVNWMSATASTAIAVSGDVSALARTLSVAVAASVPVELLAMTASAVVAVSVALSVVEGIAESVAVAESLDVRVTTRELTVSEPIALSESVKLPLPLRL